MLLLTLTLLLTRFPFPLVGRPRWRTALCMYFCDSTQIHVHGFDHKAPLMLREVLKRLLDLETHLKEGARQELRLFCELRYCWCVSSCSGGSRFRS